MKIVVVSQHVFGQRAFEGLVASEAYLSKQLDISLVIGTPVEKSKRIVGYSDLRSFATENDLPYRATLDSRLSSLQGVLKKTGHDLLVVIGWSALIPNNILDLSAGVSIGSGGGVARGVGMHPSPLPVGRGQAPIPWTILKRLEQTALSVFSLEATPDSGLIVSQKTLAVRASETSSSLFYRIGQLHFDAGQDLANQLACGQLKGVSQRSQDATLWPKRRPEDGRIAPDMSREEIRRLVNALQGPYPRAYIVKDNVAVQIASSDENPTRVEQIKYLCRDGVLYLTPRSATSDNDVIASHDGA